MKISQKLKFSHEFLMAQMNNLMSFKNAQNAFWKFKIKLATNQNLYKPLLKK